MPTFVKSSSLTLHPDGTGTVSRGTDGRRIRKLSEAETKAIFGVPVVEAIKKAPRRTGVLTVTKVDRERGEITLSGKER